MNPASWIIVDIKTGKAVMETYDKATADKAAGTGHYRAVPALEYLQTLNRNIRDAQ